MTKIFSAINVVAVAANACLFGYHCHGVEHKGTPSSGIHDADRYRNYEQRHSRTTRRNADHQSRLLRLDAQWPNEGRNEVTVIKVMNSMCKREYYPYYDRIIYEWNLSAAIHTEKHIWDDGGCDGRLRYYEGLVNVVNGRFPDEPWIARATWNFSKYRDRKRIDSVLVVMNDHFLWNDAMRTSTDVHRRQSMCHELGHALGLVHPDEEHYNRNTGSCMDYSAHPGGGTEKGINYGPHNMQPSFRDYRDLYKGYLSYLGSRHLEERLSSASGANDTIFVLHPQEEVDASETLIQDESDLNPVGEHKLDDTGELISERRSNGVVEKIYEKHDKESGLLSITMSTGLMHWSSRI